MAASKGDNGVIIIGGGIAGLTLAQGLKHRNVPFQLFERNPAVISSGYRFRLVDDALDAMERTLPPSLWAELEQSHPASSAPNLLFVDAHTGKNMRLLKTEEKRSYPIDRPWALQLLNRGIEDHVHFGKNFDRYELLPEGGIRIVFADKTTATGRILVAADGMHSRVRKQLLPDCKLLDIERTLIWGRTPLNGEYEQRLAHDGLLTEHYAAIMDPEAKDRSCIYAPIRWPQQGRLSQVVPGLSDQSDYVFWGLSFKTPPASVSLSTPESRKAYTLEVTKEWEPHLRSTFEMQSMSSAFPVRSNKPDFPVWPTDGRIVPMGDAVHAMSPTGGSGGFFALLDAAQLCDVLSTAWKGGPGWTGLGKGVEQYQHDMKARTAPVIALALENAKMLWDAKDWSEYSTVD